MAVKSSPQAARKPEARSRITNGKSLFIVDVNGEPIDGRTTLARRFRDVLDNILGDLGGRDAISEGEYQLARRATAMCVHAELLESYLAGQAFDRVNLEDYVKLVNGLNRTFSTLGLKRRVLDVTPNLHDYIAGHGEVAG